MLSLETQKRLTEFLGAEPYRRYFMSTDVQGGSGDGYYVEEGERLDFNDGRVVMRLIGRIDNLHILKTGSGWHASLPIDRLGEFTAETPQEAICLAINAYLAKEEGK